MRTFIVDERPKIMSNNEGKKKQIFAHKTGKGDFCTDLSEDSGPVKRLQYHQEKHQPEINSLLDEKKWSINMQMNT